MAATVGHSGPPLHDQHRKPVVGVDRSVHTAAANKRSMRYDPRLDRRRSIRLKGYDYSLPGDYFLTICTDRMRSLFGSAVKGYVRLNAAGTLVSEVWQNIPKRHGEVELDARLYLCLTTCTASYVSSHLQTTRAVVTARA